MNDKFYDIMLINNILVRIHKNLTTALSMHKLAQINLLISTKNFVRKPAVGQLKGFLNLIL